MAKVTREKFKVYKNVFDEFTLRTLFKLECKGHFIEEELMPISIGKEGNIFWGEGDQGEVAVKIYRLETCDFNRLYDYIKFDPRFVQLKKQRRKVIFAWAQREYRNLLIAREAGISVPTPHIFLNNVLVMEMIGGNPPAPKLKDVIPKNPQKFFDEIVNSMKKFYKAGYVHGDLSHFNILNDNEKPVLIDFAQATPLQDSNAEMYLVRDVKNVCDFFRKLGLKIDDKEILKKIKS